MSVMSDLMNTIDELNIKNNDLEKQNADLKLHLDIAFKFYEKLASVNFLKRLAEFKALSLKDMTDYYFKETRI